LPIFGSSFLRCASLTFSPSISRGRIQNSKYGPDGKCHYVESWELGVFLSPAVLGVEKLVFWSEDNARPGSATVPMPYKMYLPDRYETNDQPWAVDGPGAQK